MEAIMPTIEMPAIQITSQTADLKYMPALFFDYRAGDFVVEANGELKQADGQEAYKQWCIKQIMTERYAYMAYSDEIGVEMDEALDTADYAAALSGIERTITEALMINQRTEYVSGFEFERGSATEIHVTFTVKGLNLEAVEISMDIST